MYTNMIDFNLLNKCHIWILCTNVPPSSQEEYYVLYLCISNHATVEPPITDPPRSGQPPYNGHTPCYGMKLL